MGDQAGATLQNYNSDLVAVRCSGCMSALATLVDRAIYRRAGVYPRTHTRAALCVAVHRGAERQERRAQYLDRHR